MGLARDEHTTAGRARAPQPARATPHSAGTAVQRTLTPQSQAGNAAVVEMLRRAGHPGARDQHQHGPDCGHQSQGFPVQRSPHDATVARAEEEDEHVHGRAEDTSPEGQSALLAAAMKSSSESLPSSVVAKASAFYQNDGLASTRVHRGAVAQRATAAMGAQAMTIGHHIFLSGGTTGDEKLIGHELSHVDKNLKGIPETGHSNGAGVTVTDPRQGSERAAHNDGNAYAAGRTTAPSLIAQRTVATGSHEAVQRMMEGDEPEGRRIDLQDSAPGLSAEDHIASLPADSEEEVFLKRGVTPTQRLHMQEDMIRGSFVSLTKIIQQPDPNATKPDADDVKGYVNQARNERTAELIEFSTNSQTATQFATEAQIGIVLTVRIKRKYLEKGSSGEFGWIAKQGAPYDIVAIERKERMVEGVSLMTEGEFREAVKKEEMAEFLLSIQDPGAKAAHMNKFEGAKKIEEARKIIAYRAAVLK